MAIEERQLNSKQWEIKATGDDIGKLRGMLTETGNEAYREKFHENEGKWENISTPEGGVTQVLGHEVDEVRAMGYGMAPTRPTMVVPDLPWKKKSQSPGRHKYRYDKLSGQMVEVP